MKVGMERKMHHAASIVGVVAGFLHKTKMENTVLSK
jgi:hypothetical protein